jgi:predicted GH43/DUF377 family glycosyl hydrolase
MIWNKLGLVYEPTETKPWKKYYGILPTPVYLEAESVIRIFFGSACENNFSRVTFIDVDADNPSTIVSDPEVLSLDIGELGAFDDCGVNPSSVLKVGKEWWMYYAGFQRHERTPYSIFSGLAKSDDGREFRRFSKTPLLERTSDELILRSAPTVIYDKGIYRMIYVADNGWSTFTSGVYINKLMPTYCLRSGESKDGLNWIFNSQAIIVPEEDEFGFGRPYLQKVNDIFRLFYSIRSTHKGYRLGYAQSLDFNSWIRDDGNIGIDVSANGWDSEMICYPAVISVKNRTFLYYNGNQNGKYGFGCAELV